MSLSRRCYLAAGIFAALSCNGDRPTQPSTDAPTPGPEFSTTQIGGGTLGSPGTTTGGGGATGWTPMGSTVPNAFILVQVTGTINIATNQTCSDTFTTPCQYPLSGENVGPMGDKYGWLKVSVMEVGGSTVSLSAVPNTNMAQGLIFGMGGVVQASRTGAAQNGQSCMANPVHPGDVTNCPKKGDTKTYVEVGSYLLIGSQSVTILKIDPFAVQAAPSTVLAGAPVTFTATVDPNVQQSSLEWYWVAGDNSGSQDANPTGTLTGGKYVGCYGVSTCTYSPATSGSMYVEGKIIGKWTHKASGSITVTPITVSATPGSVFASDVVTFQATVGGSATVYTWSWLPDPPPPPLPPPLADRVGGGSTPTSGIGKPPSRGVYPNSKKRQSAVPGGPSYLSVASLGACPRGYNDCEAPVPVSGTMTVTVMVSGQPLQAAVHVTVKAPCATGDPMLDGFQAGLQDLWTRSNADDPNFMNRKEQGAWVVKNADGTFKLVPWGNNIPVLPCGINYPTNLLPPPPGTVSWVHTHPFDWLDLPTGCEHMIDAHGVDKGPGIYLGEPDQYDGDATRIFGLPSGYIIDKRKITNYAPDNNSDGYKDLSKYPRCAY